MRHERRDLLLLGMANRFSPPSAAISFFDFDVALSTFTAGMAKRAAPGPFAAAPIVQGDWPQDAGNQTSDILTAPAGSVISSLFKDNLDSTQGSIVFWVTPEWNGSLTGLHHFFYASDTLRIYASSSNLILRLTAVSFSVDISAWVPGNTYCVVARWDTNNTLDGTNYGCISWNDTHTFGHSAQPSAVDIATLYVGCKSGSAYPAQAIVEGLTIYRRVLYDGTYGIDVGNGDEINLIYAAGVGKDPTEITGSWDVCFCLPTDASPGALETGTGEAWSHPHSGNALTDGYMQTTYSGSAWTAEGTPSAGPSDTATAQKIYAWGYTWTNDAANEGVYQDVTVIPGETYIVRMVAHADGTSQPKLIAYDQTNTAEIDSAIGTTASVRADPDVLVVAITIPAGCIALRIKAVNVTASGVMYLAQIEVLPTDETITTDDFAANNSAGTIANAVLQVGSGTTVTGTEVARVTAGSPTLFTPVKLDAVSLTATPANEANSTESTGLRVSGLSTLTQPVLDISATEGHMRVAYTPRHDAADAVKFGTASDEAMVAEWYGDASNYIRLYWSAANTLTLAFNDGGGEHTNTWDATGAIDADTQYELVVDYSASAMTLKVGGVVKITITTALSFATTPTTAYWGQAQTGNKQADATFDEPDNPVVPTGAGVFVTSWKTDNAGTSNDDQITLPLRSGKTYDCIVYWGDGKSDVITDADDPAKTHTYEDGAGTYTVTIEGTFTSWYFNNGGDKLKILDVTQWGTDPVYTAYDAAWYGCTNVVFSAADVPITSLITNFSSAWQTCTGLTSFPVLDMSAGTNFIAAWRSCSSLTSFPALDVSSGTNFALTWLSCSSLTSFLALDVSAGTNFSSAWLNCSGIASFLATGMNADFVLPCDLDAAAIDVVYGNLTDRSATTSQDIDVTGNPGVGGDDPSIATALGWTVTGS